MQGHLSKGSLSRREVSVQEGVSIQEGGQSRREVSVQEGVSVREIPPADGEPPPSGKERAVRILLECILSLDTCSDVRFPTEQ